MVSDTPPVLWQPNAKTIEQANITQFIRWLAIHKGLLFDDYDALWAWSVAEIPTFWAFLAEYFNVRFHQPYQQVCSEHEMPDTTWFEGSTLNYAEHVFRQRTAAHPALVFRNESGEGYEVSWEELAQAVSRLADWLVEQGIGMGDCVAAYLPTVPEATIGFLAASSIGAVWSSCSPDFGAESVVERFQQIAPKVLLATTKTQYGGKIFDKTEVVQGLINALPSVKNVLLLSENKANWPTPSTTWRAVMVRPIKELNFRPVPFSHPIWVLYSSGTTGPPKAIAHSHGGTLLEHLKYLTFHNDVKPGERFFWYTTTGWMMWNFVQASLLAGATAVLYDGSPAFPDLNSLWKMAASLRINHFGTSAPFIMACRKDGLSPRERYDLSGLRSVSSTGSPLPPEGFAWLSEHLKPDVWPISMSGGTDVCSAFVGGVPLKPVYLGEIQRRALGCALYAFDEAGLTVSEAVGEMVIIRPMPSMPVFFWNDPDKKRYRESYFEVFEGVWRHGDWVKLTSRNTVVILGRSDATLNRDGVRIGTAEVYRALEQVPEVKDALVVFKEATATSPSFMPLFVVLAEGANLDESLQAQICQVLRKTYSPRHIPDAIFAVPEIPYTISGKKMETPIKKMLMGIPAEKAAHKGAMRNPASLAFFAEWVDQYASNSEKPR